MMFSIFEVRGRGHLVFLWDLGRPSAHAAGVLLRGSVGSHAVGVVCDSTGPMGVAGSSFLATFRLRTSCVIK